jgi:hypothetical protein
MIPAPVPTFGDIAVANGFTVTITAAAFCNVLTNNNNYGGCFIGGSFILSDNAQISASITNTGTGIVPANIHTVIYGGTGTARIVSPFIKYADNGTTGNSVVELTSTGTLFLTGNLVNGGFNTNSSQNGNCHCIRVNGNGNLNFIGAIRFTSSMVYSFQYGITKNGTGTLDLFGPIIVSTSWDRGYGIAVSNGIANIFTNLNEDGVGNGTLVYTSGSNTFINVYGNVYSTNSQSPIRISSTRQVTVMGNLSGNTGNSYCVSFDGNTGDGYLRVFGNVISNARPCIYSVGSQSNTVFVSGDVISLNNNNAIQLATNNGTVYVAGNILSYTKVVPIWSPIVRMLPPSGNTYIQYPNMYETYDEQFTTQYLINSLSAFTIPPVSAVRYGTVYGNNSLTGTCVIPPPSSVAFNVLTDNTVGQAVLSANTFFELPLQAAIEPDTFASRIKNAASVQAAGYIISSFTRK